MHRHWYVLRSKPRKETSLERFAQAQGYSVFYPTIPVKPVNPRSSKVNPYFPGYLFIHTDLEQVGESTFHWMPFSVGMVHIGGEPAVVPDMVVQAIRERVAQIWEAGGLTFDGLKKGERVMIQAGAFEGYEAIFDMRIQGSERVKVLLKMLNDRYIPLEVHENLIAKPPSD